MTFVFYNTIFAAWDKPCNVKKIIGEQYWCGICGKIRHAFRECPTIDYIWDFEKHKNEKNPHTELPLAWACEKVAYSCINTACSEYGKCKPTPGICEVCGDDITSTGAYSRVLFHCDKCGKDFEEPGAGFKTDPKIEYVPRLVEAGACPVDGTPLKPICTLSGTCPHVSS